jgi:hypothetical protein
LIFSTTFVWNISHSKNISARYDQKCKLVFVQSTRYSYVILIKLEFFRHIFEKYSNTKFNENASSGNQVFPCGRTDGETDRQTSLTKLMVALRNFANAPKNTVTLDWLILFRILFSEHNWMNSVKLQPHSVSWSISNNQQLLCCNVLSTK